MFVFVSGHTDYQAQHLKELVGSFSKVRFVPGRLTETTKGRTYPVFPSQYKYFKIFFRLILFACQKKNLSSLGFFLQCSDEIGMVRFFFLRSVRHNIKIYLR